MRREQRGDNSWKHLFRNGIVLSFILFTCCISPHEIHTTDLNPNGWKDGAEVIFENQDTTTERSLYVIARLRQDFGYDQLRVAVTTTTPKGYKWHAVAIATGPDNLHTRESAYTLLHTRTVHLT